MRVAQLWSRKLLGGNMIKDLLLTNSPQLKNNLPYIEPRAKESMPRAIV